MYLLGTNTTSLQFWVFWVHFCILSPFTGWCWYSWPAWYHLRWISSSLKVQTLHIGRARYLYRTAVWYSSSSFFLHFSEAAEVNTRKPHKWLFKQKSSYACKHSLPFADYKFWNGLKWNHNNWKDEAEMVVLFKIECFAYNLSKYFLKHKLQNKQGKLFCFQKKAPIFHKKTPKM